MKKIIGIVGEKGAGKETFGNFLRDFLQEKKKTFFRIHSSDVLIETLAIWKIPTTRENLQKLPVAMEKMFGRGALTRAVKSRIEASDNDVIVFDGVRWHSDAEMIRSFGTIGTLVYITASKEIRYGRLKERKEKVGEFNLSYKQFCEEENAPTEAHIREIGMCADFIIENYGSVDKLKEEVRVFCKEVIFS